MSSADLDLETRNALLDAHYASPIDDLDDPEVRTYWALQDLAAERVAADEAVGV